MIIFKRAIDKFCYQIEKQRLMSALKKCWWLTLEQPLIILDSVEILFKIMVNRYIWEQNKNIVHLFLRLKLYWNLISDINYLTRNINKI